MKGGWGGGEYLEGWRFYENGGCLGGCGGWGGVYILKSRCCSISSELHNRQVCLGVRDLRMMHRSYLVQQCPLSLPCTSVLTHIVGLLALHRLLLKI